MKNNLSSSLAILLSLALATTTAFADDAKKPKAKPAPAPEKAKIEVCFVLDTTGSMGGLIQGAKDKIWSIANEIVDAKITPDLKIGLIGYRDLNEDYVTKQYALTDDIDSIYADLLKFQAEGGGDTPESVNRALHEAVTDMKWSKSRDVLKLIFLVGDAPPHMDYQDDVKYPKICQLAMKKDLIINTIQCGAIAAATPIWKEIASKSEGEYAAILQSGGTVAIATPFDAEISVLNGQLNNTVCGYGNWAARESVKTKVTNNASAGAEAVASRAGFLSKSKEGDAAAAKQIGGNDDLIALIAENKISRDDIEADKLPKDVAKMSVQERNAWIDKQLKDRKDAQEKLNELLTKREAFVKTEKSKLAKEGKGDGFDDKVGSFLRRQAATKGIAY